MTGGWRKQHNEEVRDMYSWPSINRIIQSRRMRCARYVARMGAESNRCRLLLEHPEGERPLGRPNRRWVDNIEVDFGEIDLGGNDWISLA
jgi:hypothetical protein